MTEKEKADLRRALEGVLEAYDELRQTRKRMNPCRSKELDRAMEFATNVMMDKGEKLC